MRERRAVGGDVVRDELPEQGPHRGDLGVGVARGIRAEIAGPARPAERVQRVLVDRQWR